LGFDPAVREMVLVDGEGDAGRRCANQLLAGCNWVLPPPAPGALPVPGRRCRSCRLTRTRPHDASLAGNPHAGELFVRTEAAKRRLVFQLLELHLPLVSHDEVARGGLAFDFLVRQGSPIIIGHDAGVITIDLAESDDAYRARMRAELSEPYRTMLGHLRHEVGHYYWDVLVSGNSEEREAFRLLFGDERGDYQKALERHYHEGPPPGWAADHVSAYGAAHPWEDWAETWAHYLHIRDTLQTAAWYGVMVTGPAVHPSLESSLMATPDRDPQERFDDILADWLPLTYALNAINRSMGNDDLYPFVLRSKVIQKLRFVHQRVLAERSSP
jgi:hypothetical protein